MNEREEITDIRFSMVNEEAEDSKMEISLRPLTGTIEGEICTNIWLPSAITAVDAQYSPEEERITSINYVKARGSQEMRFGVYDADRP